jgi:hypothetical protein
MLRAVTSFIFISALWAAQASAQCIVPLSELQNAISVANSKLEKIAADAVKTRLAQQRISSDISKTSQQLINKLSQHSASGHRELTTLRAAQSKYEKTAQDEQSLIIARLETERTLRGARQSLNEALKSYRAQGQALVSAAERAAQGQVAPSLNDTLACEQGDCERIGKSEHAAMVAIGAIAETVDPSAWPLQDQTCDFTIFRPQTARRSIWRNLYKTQMAAQLAAQDADSKARNAVHTLSEATQARNIALARVLQTSHEPESNFLRIATRELADHEVTLPSLIRARDTAETEARTARDKALEMTRKLQQQLNYWTDIGRAIIAASLQIERDDKKPRNDLETAALVVMGANPPGKAKTCVFETMTARKASLVFTPIPAAQC